MLLAADDTVVLGKRLYQQGITLRGVEYEQTATQACKDSLYQVLEETRLTLLPRPILAAVHFQHVRHAGNAEMKEAGRESRPCSPRQVASSRPALRS
jgi:hypothetical protein